MQSCSLLWCVQVKEGMGSTVCAQGMPVKCGSLVRLQHGAALLWLLHVSLFELILPWRCSDDQAVSAQPPAPGTTRCLNMSSVAIADAVVS